MTRCRSLGNDCQASRAVVLGLKPSPVVHALTVCIPSMSIRWDAGPPAYMSADAHTHVPIRFDTGWTQSARIAIVAGIATFSNPVAAGESRMPSLYHIGRNLRRHTGCQMLDFVTQGHESRRIAAAPAAGLS